ncbi:unnamed protein product [Rhodiola kirilowii]
MEAPPDQNPLLAEIRPPRIEDAGLEDCALPPDSIREAFLKAAAAVGSRHDHGSDPTSDTESQPAPSSEASRPEDVRRESVSEDGSGDRASEVISSMKPSGLHGISDRLLFQMNWL